MQLYVADYLGDTRHLTTEQHGAYLLLLMTMWRSDGRLPNDAKKLARIAGCSPSRWAKISDEVLEFFNVDGSVLTNPRLTLELEKASEKSIKRAVSGSQGGKAKALKDKGSAVANANGLLWHSSEPEPEKKEEAKASLSPGATKAPKARSYPEAFEAAWKEYPHHKGRSSKPNAAAVWAKLPADEREGLVAAIRRFAPNVGETCGGKGAPDMAVWLKDGKHLNWGAEAGPANSTGPAPTFDGPPELRARIVALKDDAFARRWLDHYCRWRGADRTILAINATVAETLKAELAGYFAERRISVAVAAANDGTHAKQERAA